MERTDRHLDTIVWGLGNAFAQSNWAPFDDVSVSDVRDALPQILAALGFDPTGHPLPESPTVTAPDVADEPAKHTCNPRSPGKPLPFGKRDPQGLCPRCRQLDAGAAPQSAPAWVEDRQRAARDAETYDRHRREHFAPGGEHSRKCTPGISTCLDW